MRTCPVCGMKIDESSSKNVLYDGKEYVVATEDCRRRFEADPSKYAVEKEPAGPHQRGHKHGCC